jgi:hypothetical protein
MERPYVMEAARLGGLSDVLFWLWLDCFVTRATFSFGCSCGCIGLQRQNNVEALAGLSRLFWWWLGSDTSRELVGRDHPFVLGTLAGTSAGSVLMLWKQLPLVDCQICFGGGWVLLQELV